VTTCTHNWCSNHVSRGTGWYDQALSEIVFENIDFDATNWYCVLGGANQLAQRMAATLPQQKQPSLNTRVTRIDWDGSKMQVFANGSTTTSTPYTAVFNSTSLSTLKMIDTSRANLKYGVKHAMRSLSYGPAAKIALVFSEPWWRTKLPVNNIKMGGLGHSDLNIRTCVYPSYNLYDSNGKYVLLCSYSWQADAQRIGALMDNAHDPNESTLVNLVLWDLARMHTPAGETVESTYSLITQYFDEDANIHHAHDWTHDPNTAGAYAFFRPDQFAHLWPGLALPSPEFVIIGEHASPHHAWVVGALESAVVGVYQWLKNNTSLPGVVGKEKGALTILQNGVLGQPIPPWCGIPQYIDWSVVDWNVYNNAFEKELAAVKSQLRQSDH